MSLGAALASAIVLGLIRLVQRQSLRFVLQAIFPTAIAALIAARTGRAEDVFLPGILYNGFLALISAFTIAIRKPLVGFIIGAAIGDPTGWMSDRGLVKMTSKLTAVLAVPYVTRFVVQLPLFLTGHIVLLGVAKVVLGWPLLLAALFAIGLMLSKGRTPMEGSSSHHPRPAVRPRNRERLTPTIGVNRSGSLVGRRARRAPSAPCGRSRPDRPARRPM